MIRRTIYILHQINQECGEVSMKKWLFHGESLHPELADDLYVQFMSNLFSALTTAVLIGAYHILFHW